jgi:hypothetical protein
VLVALYVGNHHGDKPLVRLGWALTRLVQRGDFRRVTHVEAILAQRPDGTVVIASSTLRPEAGVPGALHNGVRIKHGVTLKAGNWRIFDVPSWSEAKASQWFAMNAGKRYDVRGAIGTAIPFVGHDPERAFCNGALGASAGVPSPHILGPAQFAVLVASLGIEITDQFFKESP